MKEMNIKSLILAFTLLLTATACVNASEAEKEAAKGFTLKGTSNLVEKSLVILSRITDAKLEVEDSAYTDKKGDFSFKKLGYDESTLYYLTFGNTQPPGIPLILENGAKVTAEVTKSSGYTAKIAGGRYNASMQKLYDIYTGHEAKMAAFNTEVATIDPGSATEELRANTTKRYSDMIIDRTSDIEDFIKTEPASPATYFAVMYLFQKPEPKFIVLGKDVMTKGLPNSMYTKDLTALSMQLGPVVEGAMAPEINLATPDGGTLALSSLRGKVVLIDFWASWCGPCRKENPAVKAIYEKYKNKGFEIYGVSLDNDGAKWKAAIAKDGLTWKHVSELKGWTSTAGEAYGVSSIPATFLIDKEGRIVKSGFRSHQLEALIQPLLQ
jgi:peroxiredoxin/uncharacterized cupredoxin-like copper-binding protein